MAEKSELSDSLEALRFQAQLLDAVGQAVIATDLDGTITYWNHTAEALYGWQSAEVLGRAISDVTPARASRKQVEDIMASLRAGERWAGEFVVQRKDGSTFPAIVTDVPFYDTAGDLAGIIGVTTDISEQKRVQQALADSEAQYRHLVEALHEGLWVIDAEGYTTFVNPRMADMLAYTEQEMLGKHLFDFMDPAHIELYKSNLERYRQGIAEQHEFEFLRKDGSRICTLMEVTPLMDATGAYTGVLAGVIDITERKQVAQALARSEKQFHAVFEQAGAGIAIASPDGKIIDVNRKLCDMLGYSKPALLERSIQTLTFSEDYEKELARTRAVFAGEKHAFDLEKRYVHKDGHLIWCHVSSNVIRDENGDIDLVIGVVIDISDRKQMERALREKQALLSGIVDNSPNLITLMEPEGAYIMANRATARFYGCETADLVGRSFEELLDRETIATFMERIDRVLETKGALQVEDLVPTPEGTRAFSTTLFPVFDSQDSIHAIGGIAIDITDRRQAEEALRISEARYRSLFVNNHAVMLLIDPDSGAIVDANPAACRYYGYARDVLITLNINQINVLSEAQVYAEMQRARTEARRQFFFRHRRANDEVRDVEVYSGPIEVRDRQLLYSIIHDITARRQAEAKVQMYTEQLENMVQEKVREVERERAKAIHMDKMVALGQMATGVAHELNQPLTVLSFESDYMHTLLEEAIAHDPERPRVSLAVNDLQEISDSVKASLLRCRRIINHVRSFGRVSGGTAILVNLNQTLENCFIFTQTRLERHGIRLYLDFLEDLPFILADSYKLEQVFLNLLSNAEYAMEKRADVEAMAGVAYEKTLHISTRVEGSHVVAMMKDNGCGIPEDVRPNIFEPFFTTKPVGEGTGLGLSISYDIVTEFGGELEFESVVGQGTTFWLRIPIAPESELGDS